MAYSYTCLTLQRIVIPLVLGLAALFRPVGISFVYLLMFFISPFIPIATTRNFGRSVTPYLIILLALSTILLLCHGAVQGILLTLYDNHPAGSCEFTEQLLRHVGFIDYRNLKIVQVVKWLVPEVVVFLTSLTVYLVTKKLTTVPPPATQMENGQVDATQSNEAPMTLAEAVDLINEQERPNFDRLIKISPVFCLMALFFAGVLRPSVPGGFYYLIFLLSGSYWATSRSLKRGFALLLRCVMVVLVVDILCVVSYQTPWMQEHIDSKTLVARLLSMEPLITSTCANDIRIFIYNTTYKVDSFLSPIAILISYYTLALSTMNLVHNRLVRNTSRKSRAFRRDSPKGVRPSNASDIGMDILEDDGTVEDEASASIFEQIYYGIVSVGGFIYQNSYIFTNILMMAWSIVYHSWLTFALLLWANLLWMIPNQRKAMMRSSPFIVIYAELLLVAQYIYGMDLTNDELPAKVDTSGINLAQIGLVRPQTLGQQPCLPLIVKTTFLLMFWVTLRQFFKEKNGGELGSGDMMGPLQLRSTTADTSHYNRGDKKTSKFLKKFGGIIKSLLVRLWIWLLVLVIFLCAITGKHMHGFRICYMALFLFFLLVFQSSKKAWLKLMYGFWIFLIFYAMTILIMIYTYQFDNFDYYWSTYLNISKTLQSDMGLEHYKTRELFLHLLSPTMIVILTVIQVHYFHNRFIESLINQRVTPLKTHSRYRSSIAISSIKFGAEQTDSEQPLKNLFRLFIKKVRQQSKRLFKNFKGVFYRFLELHLIKLVYIAAFVCSIQEVCVIHIVLVFLCIFGLICRSNFQIFISRVISFVVTIIILMKMIYQIAYLDHSEHDVKCLNITASHGTNTAAWYGLQKASDATGGLIGLLRKYIVYMVIVTLHAVVMLRQYQMRSNLGTEFSPLPKVLFPNINRQDAEKNLEGMVKYLFNYGFYKFGFEISLITLVATVTFRRDIISVAYVFWLVVLLWFDRTNCRRIWSIFETFIAVSIILQYLLFVGLPPSLCIQYPWETIDYSDSIQIWALLPGALQINHVSKLMFDFILLLVVIGQKRVYNIESRYENTDSYAGGTNKSVVKDIAKLGQERFQNPTRDFLSNIRNYLDVFKNGILCGFYWITLAVVFLAGTNISDLLAIGYLIGAFIFLWQGSDFYLHHINVILRRWNGLIAYNVVNIVIKTCLQMAGCMFLNVLTQHCCWLVHILGIHCAGRGVPSDKMDMLSEEGIFAQNDCPAITGDVVLVWDTVCFAFLIFQLRIFKSHYFCHIISDTQANSILASRGAELIEDLRQKQILHRQEHERSVLFKIKRKMEIIRATQQKMMRPVERPTHSEEEDYPIPGARLPKRKEIKLHSQAVRAGDYYMFEDMDEKFELDLIEDNVDFLDDKIPEDEKKMTRRKTVIADDKPKPAEKEKPSTTSTVSVFLRQSQAETRKDDTESLETAKQSAVDDKDESYDEEIKENPIVRLLEGFLVALTMRLNRFSRNYRYVNRILTEEKNVLKESRNFMRISRSVTKAFLMPIISLENADASSSSASFTSANNAPNANGIEIATNIQTHDTTVQNINSNTSNTISTTNQPQTQLPLEPPPQPHDPQHVIDNIETIIPSLDTVDAIDASKDEIETAPANKGAADFDLEDDFTLRDHHILIEVLISSWYAILSNTDLICYIVVFINQVVNASIISLPLPIMVFLWGTLSLPRPTKTFWVTLIAYTQAIVLIKCIFQFKLIWSNYNNLPNQPLSPEKIIGVELNANYASYDLLLLLVLFLHRFILKSQGLWKSKYRDEMMDDVLMKKYGSPDEDMDGEPDSVDKDNIAMVPSQKAIAEYETTQSPVSTETDEYIRGISRLKRTKYFSSLRKFFFNLRKKIRLPTDVYALMFLCDFINFFVLLFGFTAFGSQQIEGDGGVQTYLAENKVPIPFLIMLLVQFMLLVIDRALYLRKSLFYKIIFHFLSVIGIHIWMFFLVPAVTERSFNSLAPPIIFYMIKCCYLLFSSYQIKCGYPKRILGNFLTRSFSLVNMISFKVYMIIPFLYELRTILDWVCTDTTMTLFDWLKMEDIFADIYFIKCSRQMETDFPAIRAQKKVFYTKLLMGGTVILLIVICIWGPLGLFALGNAVGQPNVPYEVSATIRIGPYNPIYETNNRESIFTFDDAMYTKMQSAYRKQKGAITFLSNYDESDIAAIALAGNSPSLWSISPPDKQRLMDDLQNGSPLIARFTYSLTRVPPAKGLIGTVFSEVTFTINSTFPGRTSMINMLEGNAEEELVLPKMLPKFIKVLNSGELTTVGALMRNNQVYRPLVLKMKVDPNTKDIWWEIREFCKDSFHTNTLSKLPFSTCDSGIVMYTFNDKKFPSTFSFLTAGGIIGLYTTFVLLASRVLKSFIAGQNRKIMFEDLPYVDRVLQLCLDIYLVREALEFALEEDLFAKLIFLYRSPETMIKWTRPKEETYDETDTESVLSSSRRPEQL